MPAVRLKKGMKTTKTFIIALIGALVIGIASSYYGINKTLFLIIIGLLFVLFILFVIYKNGFSVSKESLTVSKESIKYTSFMGHKSKILWSEITQVSFCRYESDFPDPLVGYYPEEYWEIVTTNKEAKRLDLNKRNNRKYTNWLNKMLNDFNTELYTKVKNSKEYNCWCCWNK